MKFYLKVLLRSWFYSTGGFGVEREALARPSFAPTLAARVMYHYSPSCITNMEFDASKFFRLYEVETSGDAVPPAHLVDPEDLYQALDKLLVNDNAWQYLFFGRAPYRNAACTIAKSEKTVEGRTVLSQLYITVVLPDIGEKTLEDFSIAVRALIPQLKRGALHLSWSAHGQHRRIYGCPSSFVEQVSGCVFFSDFL